MYPSNFLKDVWSIYISHVSKVAWLQILGCPLQWCHNGHDGISNHQPHDCLLNRLFRRRSKKTSKFRVTSLCVGNSPVIGELPAQMACNTENVPIWRRHHAPVQCQATIWTNADLLCIEPVGQTSLKLKSKHDNVIQKMHLQISFTKSQSFYSGLKVLLCIYFPYIFIRLAVCYEAIHIHSM